MKAKLPVCPVNEGHDEEAWLDGLDELMEELKFDEGLPFKDPEEIWEEICYILEEENLQWGDSDKVEIRKLFNQLWGEYKS